MISKMLRRISGACCLLAISGSVHAALMLNISTSTPMVTVGDQVVLDVAIAGLGAFAADSLGGYDITVNFDDERLAFHSLIFGDLVLGNQLDLFGFGDNFQNFGTTAGSLYLIELSLDFPDDLNTLQEPAFSLAQIYFDTIGVGLGFVEFGPNPVLSDASGLDLAIGGGISRIIVDIDPRGGGPGPVPVAAPATIALFGLGLLGLGWSRRRQA